jgi:hypothetical protein
VYTYGDGKKKTVNEEAIKLLEKYRIPFKGRQVILLEYHACK